MAAAAPRRRPARRGRRRHRRPLQLRRAPGPERRYKMAQWSRLRPRSGGSSRPRRERATVRCACRFISSGQSGTATITAFSGGASGKTGEPEGRQRGRRAPPHQRDAADTRPELAARRRFRRESRTWPGPAFRASRSRSARIPAQLVEFLRDDRRIAERERDGMITVPRRSPPTSRGRPRRSRSTSTRGRASPWRGRRRPSRPACR